ncbi:hypothetical protein K239x_01150 [Planctomycetes bacterium K23_9]|uniref:Uncharacterized protein n=1 Tax=Stieleria marina TaxID=1930275 RepID=A0A517NM24_9BACT|nr:hypothetical protein K239x_01150 [Planctomycetes bacterium K23_9]
MKRNGMSKEWNGLSKKRNGMSHPHPLINRFLFTDSLYIDR